MSTTENNNKKIILSILGTRPQFIKSALLSAELRKRGFTEICVHTGQHYDESMSGIFFDELKLPKPDYLLSHGGNTHATMTGKMMIDIERIVKEVIPDMIMVYGDCNTTLAGALVASKLLIPLVHVESGLRSFDKRMPEEVNRVLTDNVSSLLLCPNERSVENLKNESITNNVYVVGDLMIQLLRFLHDRIQESSVRNELGVPREYYLSTIHRQENTTKKRLSDIFNWFSTLPHPVVLAIHPRTKKVVTTERIQVPENVLLVPPQGYVNLLSLVLTSKAVLTDSGGLQKEAYDLGVPCFTLRETTEWTELVDIGWNKLIPSQFPQDITQEIEIMKKKRRVDLYPLKASEEIVDRIISFAEITE